MNSSKIIALITCFILILCGQTTAEETAGACVSSASWEFETSNQKFTDTDTIAVGEVDYTDANGNSSRFYYRLTFKHDPRQGSKQGESYPYFELEEKTLNDYLSSIDLTIDPEKHWYWFLGGHYKPNELAFNAYRNSVYAHENQHFKDITRWPVIGNGKINALFDKFSVASGARDALDSGYTQVETIMQQIRRSDNDIRSVLEARAVHAELRAHYNFINEWISKAQPQDSNFVPFLYKPKTAEIRINFRPFKYITHTLAIKALPKYNPLIFQLGIAPHTYADIKDISQKKLAEMVVNSRLYSDHSSYKKLSQKSTPYINIKYSYDNAGHKYTYEEAHRAFFGGAAKTAEYIVRESKGSLNSESDSSKSFKRLKELQKKYNKQIAALIAIYAKWKYYDNRPKPADTYSIKQEDISWIDDSVPEVIDSLAYTQTMAVLMQRIDWFKESDDYTPEELRCLNLIKAKKVAFLTLGKSPSMKEKDQYIRELYVADATILRNIARMVEARNPKDEDLNLVLKAIRSAQGMVGVMPPPQVELLIQRNKKEEADRKRRGLSKEDRGAPKTIAEYYDSLADLMLLFKETRSQNEEAVIAQSLLFFVAGRASKRNVDIVVKQLQEIRAKEQKKQQKNHNTRR